MADAIVSAKNCAKCGALKALTEFHVLNSRRDGRKSYCKQCIQSYSAARYRAHRERKLAVNRAWVERNQARMNAARVAWAKANRERMRVVAAAWYRSTKAAGRDPSAWRKANPEKHRAAKRKYARANLAKYAASCAARLAKRLQATPSWANKFFIAEAYDLAQRRTQLLGYRWHVDHIVPLRSPLVCGLHVHNNLQVIPAIANLSKNNRRWPDMP
jgi:hypothetical protein